MAQSNTPHVPLKLSTDDQQTHYGYVGVAGDKYLIDVELDSDQRLWIQLHNPSLRLLNLAESKSKGPVVSVIKHDIRAEGKAQILEPGDGVTWLDDFQVTIMWNALLKMADPYRAPSETLEGRWTGLNLFDQSITIIR